MKGKGTPYTKAHPIPRVRRLSGRTIFERKTFRIEYVDSIYPRCLLANVLWWRDTLARAKTENLGKKKMWRNFCGEKGLGGKRERWLEGGEKGKWWVGNDCTGRERSTSMSLCPLSLSSYTNDL